MRTITLPTVCLFAFVVLATALPGDSQQRGATTKKLPAYWNKETLKITKDQEEKILQIQDEYGAKIDKLKKEIDTLEKERNKKRFDVLNDTQKKLLREIYLQKLGIDPFAEPKKAEPDKGK
jgi:hypothetical protein